MPNIQTAGMQMPVASKSAAQQVQATNDIALQQQMKQAGANTPVTTADIQNLGTQQAQQQTALGQAEQQASLSDTINSAQRDFQTQQNQAAQQGIMDDQARAQARIDAEERLASLGSDVRETLLDRELRLNENTNQLQFTNERQMADLAIKLSTDERDLANNLREMEQASNKEMQAAQFEVEAYAQAQDFIKRDRELSADIDLQRRIAQAQRDAEDRARKARKKAGVTRKIIGAAKIAAGVAIATVPGGQAAGASVAVGGASDIAQES